MPLILGHRGFSAGFLENSMQAFRAALDAGMDGFELDVQPTRDGICVVLHDADLARTAQSAGILRQLRAADLPCLKNGEPVPYLSEVLTLPASLMNVELKGRPGWQLALATVERAGALSRVLFSSFEHSEIFELQSARAGARCGLLWNKTDSRALSREYITRLPPEFVMHLPLEAVRARPEFWSAYASRLLVWGLDSPDQARALPFEPAILVTDGI